MSGRPKSKKSGLTDISGLLNERVKVKAGDRVREMGPFEAGLRKLDQSQGGDASFAGQVQWNSVPDPVAITKTRRPTSAGCRSM